MNDQITKALINSAYHSAQLISQFRLKKEIPFFCIITPVFDPSLISVRALIADLQEQTFADFKQILISNGSSREIKRFVEKLNKKDKRFVYDEIPEGKILTSLDLLVNLGKRRNYSLKKYIARRYLFFDADLKITDKNFLAKLFVADKVTKKDVILARIKYQGTILPKRPIRPGAIDMANISFSRKIVDNFSYPTDFDPSFGYGNDFRFFSQISTKANTILIDSIFAIKDASRSYKRSTDLFLEENVFTNRRISVFGNSFDDKEIQALAAVLGSHIVGVGEVVEEFEKKLAKRIGFKYAASANSCTNAFWLLFKALKFTPLAEVILPNIHFYGVKNVLDLLKIKTVVADVGSNIPNLTLKTVKQVLTSNTKAIIFLEYGGYPAEVDKIRAFLKRNGRDDIILVIDAANSPFTQTDGKYTARSYDFAVFSFDMNKILVTGDGGMVLSENKTVIEKIKQLSYYGLKEANESSFARSFHREKWWEVKVEEPSLKLSMNNLTAAMGIAQLGKIDKFLAKREEIRVKYVEKLNALELTGYISLPRNLLSVKNQVYLFWLKVLNGEIRDNLAQHLIKKGVYTTVKYQPVSEQKDTPNAHDFYNRSLCLPLNQNITETEQDYIISQIYGFFESTDNEKN